VRGREAFSPDRAFWCTPTSLFSLPPILPPVPLVDLVSGGASTHAQRLILNRASPGFDPAHRA